MPKKSSKLSVAPTAHQRGTEPLRSPFDSVMVSSKPPTKSRQADERDEERAGAAQTAAFAPELPPRPARADDDDDVVVHPPQPTRKAPTVLPPSASMPSNPKASHGHTRSPFSPYPRSKSASKVHGADATIRSVPATDAEPSAATHEHRMYALGAGAESSPDLLSTAHQHPPELIVVRGPSLEEEDCYPAGEARMVTHPGQPIHRRETAPRTEPVAQAPKKARLKPRPFAHILSRTRSVRTDPAEQTPKTTPKPPKSGHGGGGGGGGGSSSHPDHRFAEQDLAPHKRDDNGMKTAPLHDGDRSFREMMSSTMRNRSADRHPNPNSESGSIRWQKETQRENQKENQKQGPSSFSSSFKDGTGSVLLSSLKTSSTRAADGIGKAGKGFFGKLGRSGSSNEREVVNDENYKCRVINLPLIEQTRRTRISKRLEASRDKTEFWMPALPWRCIDYLNFRGNEEEGLYRVPGSGIKVKQWQRRFDTELDINLFEEPELYDINIIGSMFKAWLRELPDEIFPKATQARISELCAGATEVPQMLKDELSKLPPYNYYLLFAITCHLSLLHSYVEQNKMDYRNLCICFQPCLKMDSFCFHFLVCDWRSCWQGCWTEKEALEAEQRWLDGGERGSSAGDSTLESAREPLDERALSSSESSKPPSFGPAPLDLTDKAVVTPLPTPTEEEHRAFHPAVPLDPLSSSSSSSSSSSDRRDPAGLATPSPLTRPQLAPELSPLLPMSPLHL